MIRRLHLSVESAFLVAGVLIMVATWALNLVGVLSGEPGSGHGGGDLYLWLFLMAQGLGFATVGVVYANYRELLANPVLARRYLVGFLFIADGGIHLLALNQHLPSSVPAAAFFAIVAAIQIPAGMAFAHLPPKLDPLWLLFTGFLIAAFIVARAVPVGPLWSEGQVEPLGVLSKLVEFLAVGILVSLRWAERVGREKRQVAPLHPP